VVVITGEDGSIVDETVDVFDAQGNLIAEEEIVDVYDADGQLLTASLMDYTLPRAAMIPPIETVFVEVPSEHGAYGAKGVGEPPAIPGPATIANAIRDAAGVRVTSIPIKPEVLARALWAFEGQAAD